ncbi:MAG: 16S rRNA (cytosine(1402)-N(4))-methyltransferase RsmH [Bacteroidales bacterium]|nr:16S rRNA (cytosine(1402)-N(4))-methyltransferase RsmH [Bacteroidales bacterium]
MMYHKPVLLKESIDGLNIKPDGIYVDATFGGGGHAQEILNRLDTGRLIAFDQDEDALENDIDDERFMLLNQNFMYIKNFLKLYKAIPVDGILADLGISSHQIDTAERGFSTRLEGELDLRMNRKNQLTAQKIINDFSENQLATIFKKYGEVRNPYPMINAIVRQRKERPITSTTDLKEVIEPFAKKGKEHQFFARIFQALRIEVNQEMYALEKFLKSTYEVLKDGSRLVVISYHSLEDRLVKNYIKAGNFEGKIKKDFYGNPEVIFKSITRKPVTPSEEELERNPRSRSAKLRIAEKLSNNE